MITTITVFWLLGGIVNIYLIKNYNKPKYLSLLAFPFGIVGVFLAFVIMIERLLELIIKNND